MMSLRSALLLSVLLLCSCAPNSAQSAQVAPNYQSYTYACDGQQHANGFALDYGQAVYIRHIEMVIVGALPGQYGTVTLSTAVPPGQSAPFIAGFGGVETSAHIDFGVNGWMVPAAQSLAPEYSCAGGGSRTLLLTIGYAVNAGPNP